MQGNLQRSRIADDLLVWTKADLTFIDKQYKDIDVTGMIFIYIRYCDCMNTRGGVRWGKVTTLLED